MYIGDIYIFNLWFMNVMQRSYVMHIQGLLLLLKLLFFTFININIIITYLSL
jgi:hypothetical protein